MLIKSQTDFMHNQSFKKWLTVLTKVLGQHKKGYHLE